MANLFAREKLVQIRTAAIVFVGATIWGVQAIIALGGLGAMQQAIQGRGG